MKAGLARRRRLDMAINGLESGLKKEEDIPLCSLLNPESLILNQC
jgi:hypothetical protein